MDVWRGQSDFCKVVYMVASSTITPRSEWRLLSKHLERQAHTVAALDLLLEAIEEGRLTDKTPGQRPGRGVVLWLDRHADVSHGIMTTVLESAGVDRLPNNRFQLSAIAGAHTALVELRDHHAAKVAELDALNPTRQTQRLLESLRSATAVAASPAVET